MRILLLEFTLEFVAIYFVKVLQNTNNTRMACEYALVLEKTNLCKV